MAFISRMIASLTLATLHRQELRKLLHSTPSDNCILTLNPGTLRQAGIGALALDFDGVLAPHGSPEPLPEAVQWLQRCEEVFPGNKIFILSNKPTDGRRLWFTRHFPAIRFISGVRKKPYPDGINRVAELANVPPSAILMVDDRLLTGCLAALIAGAPPCYIRSPYIALGNHTVAELFFWLLRAGERWFLRLISL